MEPSPGAQDLFKLPTGLKAATRKLSANCLGFSLVYNNRNVSRFLTSVQ